MEKPAKLGDDPTTKEEANAQLANPAMPNLYTMRVDYLAQRGDM